MRTTREGRWAPLALGAVMVASVAAPASGRAQQQERVARTEAVDPEPAHLVEGVTSAGRAFAGSVRTHHGGGGARAVATLTIEGLGHHVLEAQVPLGARVRAVRVRERAGSSGARGRLGALLGEQEDAPERPVLTLEPVLSAPEPVLAAPEPASSAEPAPFGARIVASDGRPLAGEAGAGYELGEMTVLRARLLSTGRGVPAAEDIVGYRWEVDGPAIRAFTQRLAPGSDPFDHVVEQTAEPLAEADLRGEEVSFYLTRRSSEGFVVRVRIDARGPRGPVSVTASVRVAAHPSSEPARRHFAPQPVDARGRTVGQRHYLFHARHHFTEPGRSGGARFVRFHRGMLAAYEGWRERFGYEPVAEPPAGALLGLPAHLTAAGRAAPEPERNGPAIRRAGLTLASLPRRLALSPYWEQKHLDAWRRAHPGSDRPARLADFDTLDQLADAIEHPWLTWAMAVEAARPGAEGVANAELGDPRSAPRCEAFWVLLRAVERVVREWERERGRAAKTGGATS